MLSRNILLLPNMYAASDTGRLSIKACLFTVFSLCKVMFFSIFKALLCTSYNSNSTFVNRLRSRLEIAAISAVNNLSLYYKSKKKFHFCGLLQKNKLIKKMGFKMFTGTAFQFHQCFRSTCQEYFSTGKPCNCSL